MGLKAMVLGALAIGVALIYRRQQKDRLPIIVDGKVEPGFEEVLQVFR